MVIFFLIIIAVCLVLALYATSIYNRLVRLRQRYKNAYAQIDVQLKRRYDLIPNLVDTAKGYLKHERETLEAVIQARNQAQQASQQAAQDPGDPEAMQNLAAAETMLTGTLGRFFALSEAYPDLKANETMGQLMEELRSTENRVAFARQAYNDAVMDYNTKREVFPDAIFAQLLDFKPAELFQLEDEEQREVPRVSFE